MVTHSFGKRNFMQPLVRLSMPSWRVQLFLFEGELGGTFFSPPGSQCVLDMFPSSSQSIPKCIPQDVPNSTWVCPKLNSHVYNPKRWNVRKHICFYFVTGGPKMCSHWGVLNVPKDFVDGPMDMARSKKKTKKQKKSYERTHDLINVNHATITQLTCITRCPPQVLLLNKVPKISFILRHTSVCPWFLLLFQFLLWWSKGESLLLRMSSNLRLVPWRVVTRQHR
jgi:hypothetical protein